MAREVRWKDRARFSTPHLRAPPKGRVPPRRAGIPRNAVTGHQRAASPPACTQSTAGDTWHLTPPARFSSIRAMQSRMRLWTTAAGTVWPAASSASLLARTSSHPAGTGRVVRMISSMTCSGWVFVGRSARRFRIEPRRAPYRLPNSAAVSDIRLENPHSLSYHPITRVSAPSTTAVCVASNVHDAGQWLKSTDTSGRVL